jgi:antirestriction protein ArdC
LLALFQCAARGVEAGPLATFPKWKELGRSVKKGEKALMLCMPVTCKRTKRVLAEDGTESEEGFAFTHFTYKSHWFVLSQTEGVEYVAPAIPDWDQEIAIRKFDIALHTFQSLDGNVQGYANDCRQIAINPLAAMPHKTLFHELAHILLGHCDKSEDSEMTAISREHREVEAEAVALLCCESLNLPGAEYSRGYIQSWGHGQTISERSAQRIFRVADQILRAGRPDAAMTAP